MTCVVERYQKLVLVLLLSVNFFLFAESLYAQTNIPLPKIEIGVTRATKRSDVSTSLQVLALLTILSLAPSLLIMVTSFTRIVVVLSFVRRALATQQLPSNQILIGVALMMTFFIMSPVFQKSYNDGLKPYFDNKMGVEEAIKRSVEPFRIFMLKQTREKDLALFVKMAKNVKPKTYNDIPIHVVIPAFILSELKLSFEMGIVIFLPFLIVDMVVASTLMSMGMIMLPPVMISLPFKILIFVLVDGWYLIVRSLLVSFN
jgi:flagellar biosynthetic protein FliP